MFFVSIFAEYIPSHWRFLNVWNILHSLHNKFSSYSSVYLLSFLSGLAADLVKPPFFPQKWCPWKTKNKQGQRPAGSFESDLLPTSPVPQELGVGGKPLFLIFT